MGFHLGRPNDPGGNVPSPTAGYLLKLIEMCYRIPSIFAIALDIVSYMVVRRVVVGSELVPDGPVAGLTFMVDTN